MAVLDEANRFSAWAEANRTNGLAIQGVLKVDLRAAVDAIDNWLETNATALNTAIPQPARGALTARQKAALLMLVVDRRFGVLP
jgi:hypothetical protein